jgi:hypothetical protein
MTGGLERAELRPLHVLYCEALAGCIALCEPACFAYAASGVRRANASNDNSQTRSRSASSASKTAAISSRQLDSVFEYYAQAPTKNPTLKPLKPKWRK